MRISDWSSDVCSSDLLGLSRSLADELAPFGITVNTIPPGFIDTGENYEAFFQRCAETVGLTYDQFMANLIRRIPMNRFGRPEEVASLCAYLSSQNASYITAQYLVVEGGHMETYFKVEAMDVRLIGNERRTGG